MPTLARQRAEARKRRGHAWQLVGAVLMAAIPAVIPRSPWLIAVSLIVVFCVGIPAAKYGYFDKPKRKTVFALMLAHLVLLCLLGWYIWPKIKITPQKISFSGFANETFNFTARNETSEDAYDIQIPFLIGYGKHLDDNISAKVYPASGDPPEAVTEDYSYCYGKGPDVHKVLPNEQEVLIVKIRHLIPNATASFTISNAGNTNFDTQPGKATFVDSPYSYAPNMGRTVTRGDYRICKFIGKINQ